MSKSSNSKTTISGVPPKFDQAEYDRRFAIEVHKYKNTTDCLELVSLPLEHDFLQAVADKVNSGYKISRRWSVSHAQLSHSVYLEKPEAQQEAEIAALHSVVKTAYVTHLETERVGFQNQLRQQLIEAEEAKLQAQRETEERARLEAIEKQVQACYKPLVIPE